MKIFRQIMISLLASGLFALIGSIEWGILAQLGVSTHPLCTGVWIMFYYPLFAGINAVLGFIGTLVWLNIDTNQKYNKGFFILLNSRRRYFLSITAIFTGSLAGGLLWAFICPQFLNIQSFDDEIIYAILLAPATIIGGITAVSITYIRIRKSNYS